MLYETTICKDLGVPEDCYKHLCNPTVLPDILNRHIVFEKRLNCGRYIVPITKCLTQGRDVGTCCLEEDHQEMYKDCYGMCNGTVDNYGDYLREDFLMCFVSNVPTIFPCLLEGYKYSPTPPRNLELVSKTNHSAKFIWDEPAEFADSLDHYRIHLTQRTGQYGTGKYFITKERNFTLEGLISNFAYTVHVVAHAGEYKNNSDWYKSGVSNLVLFNIGPQLAVSKNELLMPNSTKTVILFCQLKLISYAERSLEWVKTIGDETIVLESTEKYSIKIYQPEHRLLKDTILSALKINDFDENDFGSYRCYIKNTRIEYYETNVTLWDHSEQTPATNPPETLLECCSKNVEKEHCRTICTKGVANKKAMIRPEHIIPPFHSCKEELNQLLKCTHDGLNAVPCCVHHELPYSCLGLCNEQFPMEKRDVRWFCKDHYKTIYKCKLEAMDNTPEGLGDVRPLHIWGWTFRFSWDKVEGAKVYHVYTRRKEGKWKVRVTLDNTVDVTRQDEAVIIAVNEFGQSLPYRLYYDINGWEPVDHW
ncbi:Protein CBG05054 [Caenorhabditis briggsae]|uniref:Protein CBG05054 n=1 Tax=Caenorhabditis briggsae TaxID=6238 RepID=A8WZ26_CAEBR|nr:Protein CBG05054 [Caenorhabditis briggsae]CAP25636.1 Protein CBG05054 [Caenorhabditis briggsae]